MQCSPDISEISAALVTAQGELENATKGNVNPAYRSKYADLTACLDVVRPCFAKHGLAVVQGIERSTVDGCIDVTTRLIHKSGQWMESTATLPLGKRDAQGVGAAATYGRRYGLTAMAGLGQEDDDGNSASNVKPKAPVAKESGALDQLRLKFAAAKTAVDLDALAREFAKLSPTQQNEIMPVAKAARTRCGL